MAAPPIWAAGVQQISPATGAERIVADAGGAVLAELTSQQIAALGSSGSPLSQAAVTAVVGTNLTAANIVAGIVVRTGPTAAFSDTLPTAASIIAAIPGAFVGQSFEVSFKNGTAFPQTLLTNTGLTLPATVVVPPNSIGTYLLTLGASTVVIAHVATTLVDGITPAQFSTAALAAGTLAAGLITGAVMVVLQNTGATPGAQTVRTAAQLLADFNQARVGLSYMLRIVNTGAGTLTLTADAGATVTITGTATVATNTFRDYIVTFNTATTATIQSVGSGVSP